MKYLCLKFNCDRPYINSFSHGVRGAYFLKTLWYKLQWDEDLNPILCVSLLRIKCAINTSSHSYLKINPHNK
jgi:hypothetical protein